LKRCHAESYCKQFNEQRSNCHEHCIGFIQLQNIYTLSNMPKRYQFENQLHAGQDRDSFIYLRDWMQDVTKHVEAGEGLFLISETKGNGKTSWSCKIMNEYFKRVALTNNLRCRGLFINVPQFFQDLKQSFDNPSDEFTELMNNIKTADLVIWDDIGTESPTRFVRDTLYTFINHRYAEEKSQIFTSNVSLEMMNNENWLGERTVSRIVGSCEIVRFSGQDRRLEK
jgi:DNA replication protein DnaC